MDRGEIIIYQTADGETRLDVRMENDSVWLTQAQMVELFNSTKQNVSLHINNIFRHLYTLMYQIENRMSYMQI